MSKKQHHAMQVRATEAQSLVSTLLTSGLTMEQIAVNARVSVRSVYRWLNEGRSPHPIWLESLRKMHDTQGIRDAHQQGQE